MLISKKFLKILPLIVMGLFAAGFVFARELEVTYPVFNGVATPESTRALLPDYVKYIFTLAIALSGLVAFGVIFFAGFKYFTSGGNPAQLSEAKNQIIQALIGIVIILGSYLLLNTINPELIIINPATAKGEGVILYEQTGCPGTIAPDSKTNFIKLGVSAGDLENVSQKVGSIWLFKDSSELEVKLYPEKNWGGEPIFVQGAAGTCVPSPWPQAMSIELNWKNPGVYLCENDTKKKCSVYSASAPALAEGFEDKVSYIYFKNPTDSEGNPTFRYGAVLHEGGDFTRTCDVFFSDGTENIQKICESSDGKTCRDNDTKKATNYFPADGVSSITVFRQNDQPIEPNGVTLYESTNYNNGTERYGAGQITLSPDKYPDFSNLQFSPSEYGSPKKKDDIDDTVSSLKVKNNNMLLLFHNKKFEGRCEVFIGETQDPDLKSGNHIGEDAASSAKIIPVK